MTKEGKEKLFQKIQLNFHNFFFVWFSKNNIFITFFFEYKSGDAKTCTREADKVYSHLLPSGT